jgi:hypothetical protein
LSGVVGRLGCPDMSKPTSPSVDIPVDPADAGDPPHAWKKTVQMRAACR